MASSLLLGVYSASSLMPRINDYLGYKNLCAEIPEETRVVTLNVHRPDNMDVYLGREIFDYGKDADAFIAAEMDGDTPKNGPMSLIVKTSKIQNDTRLVSLQEKYTVAYVGEYCIMRIPGGSDSSPLDE